MYQNSYRGKFIAFEGLDGSGQSTESSLLYDFLKDQGVNVLLTKEPTSESPIAQDIDKYLKEEGSIEPEELQRLFAQDRKWHLDNVIIPSLKQGIFVISDRYFFSSLAYGSLSINLNLLLEINQDFILPDLTIFLDVRPEICIQRIQNRGGDKTLFEKLNKLEDVYKNYKKILPTFPNVVFINGERTIGDVFEDIKKVVLEKFPEIRERYNS